MATDGKSLALLGTTNNAPVVIELNTRDGTIIKMIEIA
jgi:hypothetical protein